MAKPESFEVTEYSPQAMDVNLAYRALRQIMVEQERNTSTAGVWIDMVGDTLKVHYHSYEMFLPTRLREVEARANDAFKETLSLLKKEFKVKTGHLLKLSEMKADKDYTVEKVSLNERYYYKAWRFFRLTWE